MHRQPGAERSDKYITTFSKANHGIMRPRLQVSTWGYILVIILLFLLSPVLIKLVDLHSSISLLDQVKSLNKTQTKDWLQNGKKLQTAIFFFDTYGFNI